MLSVFLVCFDSENEGRLYSPYLKNEVVFDSQSEFFLIADGCCDRMASPQHSMEPRTFGERRALKHIKHIFGVRYDTEAIRSKGKAATFLVTISFRYNASWQGTVRWVEGEKHEDFRSVLELLRIFNGVFTNGTDEDAIIDSAFLDF